MAKSNTPLMTPLTHIVEGAQPCGPFLRPRNAEFLSGVYLQTEAHDLRRASCTLQMWIAAALP